MFVQSKWRIAKSFGLLYPMNVMSKKITMAEKTILSLSGFVEIGTIIEHFTNGNVFIMHIGRSSLMFFVILICFNIFSMRVQRVHQVQQSSTKAKIA